MLNLNYPCLAHTLHWSFPKAIIPTTTLSHWHVCAAELHGLCGWPSLQLAAPQLIAKTMHYSSAIPHNMWWIVTLLVFLSSWDIREKIIGDFIQFQLYNHDAFTQAAHTLTRQLVCLWLFVKDCAIIWCSLTKPLSIHSHLIIQGGITIPTI